MALPSQMERSSELGRPYTSRGAAERPNLPRPRRNTVILAAIAGGLALLVVAAYGVQRLRGSSKPPSDSAALQAAALGGLTATTDQPDSAKPPVESLGTPSSSKPAAVDVTRPAPVPAAPPSAGTTPPSGTTTLVPSIPNAGSTSEVRSYIEMGDRALAANKLVDARKAYSLAYLSKEASRGDQDGLRGKLTTINEDLVFSPKVAADDPLVETYTVLAGDNPTKIFRKRQLATDISLIQRVNNVDPGRLRVGQKLKLVRGPFHAVVRKSEFRADIFAGSPDAPEDWLYIRSVRVGLGTNDGTPVGNFVVKKGSKLVNPYWTNPQTGEKFDKEDPKNPIGERWIGIEGVGSSSAYTGFGLHGTIDPDSVGQQKSMGCVRMGAEDIAAVYQLLVEQISVVKIVP